MKKPKLLSTIEALAAGLGVSVRTARRYQAAGMPRERGGRWNLERARAWRAGKAREAREARRRLPAEVSELRALTRTDRLPPDDFDDLDDVDDGVPVDAALFARDAEQQLAAGLQPRQIVAQQEARRRYWSAERERTAALRERAELVPAHEATERVVRLCTAFRRMFLEHCRRTAPMLMRLEDTLEAQRILEREAEAALEQIQCMGGIPS